MLREHPGRTLTIRTAEGIEFAQPLASPAIRMLASMIDYAIVIGVMELVQIPLLWFQQVSFDVAQAIVLLATFLIGIGYSIFFEWRSRGQTIGKRVLRIRVVHRLGLKLQFSQVVMRNLLRVVDQVPIFYLVGGTAAMLDRYSRRIGDMAAGTVVVAIPKPRPPMYETGEGEKYNSIRERATLAARLRQEVSPELADIALRAIERRASLEPEARLALFGDLAAQFRALVRMPDEVVLGISDERLVLNVVDVLFRSEDGGRS